MKQGAAGTTYFEPGGVFFWDRYCFSLLACVASRCRFRFLCDLRDLPLSMRKTNLDRLLRGRPDGIFANPFDVGAIGPDLFHAACSMGLEGLVSKRSDRPYRGGRSPHWIKVKNRHSPAMTREVGWSR